MLFEYIWLDGYNIQNLRSKVKVLSEWDGTLQKLPVWNFDGSSTAQAPGDNSECILQPIRFYKFAQDHYFVLCEVMDIDGNPHPSNTRHIFRELCSESPEEVFWFGYEQEYFITKNGSPLGFPPGAYPSPQGRYYCGVGNNQVMGRQFVERHLAQCLRMGIRLTGINAEVAIGQWEYQCFSKNALQAADDLWMSRYVLYRLGEEEGVDINIDPKPVKGDWNGSGCHTNFSNNHMRTIGGEGYFNKLFNEFAEKHREHIIQYGEDNAQRLTGEHETQHIDTFSWGIADRGASMRLPLVTFQRGWQGYVEDRRPASNCDPYKVGKLIMETTMKLDYKE